MGQYCSSKSSASKYKTKERKKSEGNATSNFPDSNLKCMANTKINDSNSKQIPFIFSDSISPSCFTGSLQDKDVKQNLSQMINNNSNCFITTENLRQIYSITDNTLGKGTYGSVKEAYFKSNPSKRFAIKCISKDKESGEKFEWLFREVQIFRQLDHPNIAKLYEAYQDSRQFYLVMEICDGGQLLEKVMQQKRFSEQFACQVIQQIFSAVKYLHSMGIVHRDLKPDNFLFTQDGQDIKMIDFGLSKQYNNNINRQQINATNPKKPKLLLDVLNNTHLNSPSQNKIQTVVGTVQYIAPEVLTGQYDYRCDIWSLGVILYCLLSGEFPFPGNGEEEILQKIKKGHISFNEELLLSKQAKDLIQQLICVDPNKRISIQDALKHPWFKLQKSQIQDNPKVLQIKHITNLQTYHSKLTSFQRFFIHVALKVIGTDSFITEHSRLFRKVDINNDGTIVPEALQKQMLLLGFTESTEQVTCLLKNVNSASIAFKLDSLNNDDGNTNYVFQNNIDLEEKKKQSQLSSLAFLEANFDRNLLKNEESVQKVFNMLDWNKSGYIDDYILDSYFMRQGYQKASNNSLFSLKYLIGNDLESRERLSFQECFSLLQIQVPSRRNSPVEEVIFKLQKSQSVQNKIERHYSCASQAKSTSSNIK